MTLTYLLSSLRVIPTDEGRTQSTVAYQESSPSPPRPERPISFFLLLTTRSRELSQSLLLPIRAWGNVKAKLHLPLLPSCLWKEEQSHWILLRVLSESDQERTNVLTVISIHRNKHFMRVLIIKRAALISEVA